MDEWGISVKHAKIFFRNLVQQMFQHIEFSQF